ncbi:MAG: PIN domain-containing protein [Oscillospiraceae bacterium]|nr:PIN domain-containing protein [Oscillospiraceae bacterium]
MKIYFDNCCYFRPFDDQTQDRVLIETNAITAILFRCTSGVWELIGSEVLEFEMSKVNDTSKLEKVKAMYKSTAGRITINDEIRQRANLFSQYGVSPMDALHVASAESAKVDVYLTTDDALIKRIAETDIKIDVRNPVHWIMEVLENE